MCGKEETLDLTDVAYINDPSSADEHPAESVVEKVAAEFREEEKS
jgi:hypothetical protein